MTVSANQDPFTVRWHNGSTYLAGVVTSDERDWDVLEDVLGRLQKSGVLAKAYFDKGGNGMLAFTLGTFEHELPDGDELNDVSVVELLLENLLNKEGGARYTDQPD